MALIEISHLQAELGARTLFTVAAVRLEPGRRAALIGPNGVGKSTLLRAIAASGGAVPAGPGPAPPYGSAHARQPRVAPVPASPVSVSGTIAMARGASVLLLPQEPPCDGPPPPAALRVAWHLPDLPLVALSGGQRTRAALAAALAAEADLLLLDEPTNHLDTVALELLEQGLRAHRGAVLLVSHDRVFLDRVATEVWELDRPWGEPGGGEAGPARGGGASLRVYPGNYSAYRAQAGLAAETERRAFAGHQRERERLEAAVRQQREWTAQAFAAAGVRDPRAQRLAKKAAKKGKAYERRLERSLGEAPPKPWERDRPRLPVAGTCFGGPRLVVAEGLVLGPLGPGGPLALRCDRLELGPRDRVALMGRNGGGKTTLLRVLGGEITPCAGSLWRSPALRMASVRQGREELPASGSAADAIAAVVGGALAAGVRAPGGPVSVARTACAALGLRGERATAPLGALSGGERTAVALARALVSGANLLLLDEPTNHLDLWLREAAEEALAAFPGAVVVATHDRWLAEHWAEAVWEVGPAAAGGEGTPAGLTCRRRRPEVAAAGAAPGPESGPGTAADLGGPAPKGPGTLASRMRLAELTGRLADPRLARRPRERAAIEGEIEALVRAQRDVLAQKDGLGHRDGR